MLGPAMQCAVALCLALHAVTAAVAASLPAGGVPPLDALTCPPTHPIKATFNARTRQCVYHVPGGAHYRAARPDICFATEDEARLEDCWRAEEVL